MKIPRFVFEKIEGMKQNGIFENLFVQLLFINKKHNDGNKRRFVILDWSNTLDDKP